MRLPSFPAWCTAAILSFFSPAPLRSAVGYPRSSAFPSCFLCRELTAVIPTKKRAFVEVLTRANEQMRSVFGMEIVELRARRKGDLDDPQTQATQTQRKKKRRRRRGDESDASESSDGEEGETVTAKSELVLLLT